MNRSEQLTKDLSADKLHTVEPAARIWITANIHFILMLIVLLQKRTSEKRISSKLGLSTQCGESTNKLHCCRMCIVVLKRAKRVSSQ